MNTVELQLQINDVYQPVDIDEKTSISMTFKQSDLSNPTVTKIPYSSQIALPKTKNNNQMFACMGIQSTANVFNPLELVNFRLYVNNNIFQQGYINVEEVDIAENGYYRIRLYGGMGQFFNYLSTQPLNSLNPTAMYKGELIDCTHNVTAETVHDLMVNDNGLFGYAVTYQGQYDKFENGSVQDKDSDGRAVIEEATWQSGSTRFSNPVLDENRRSALLSFGEYRSYYQKPTIKHKPLIEAIVERAESAGFKIFLDPDFFSEDNPYYADVWYICPSYEIGDIAGGMPFSVSEFGDTGTDRTNSTLKIDKNSESRDFEGGIIPPTRFISTSDSASINCPVAISDSIPLSAGDTINVSFLTKMIATFYDNDKDDQRTRLKDSDLICSLQIVDSTSGIALETYTPKNVGSKQDVEARVFNNNNVQDKRPSNRDASYFGEQNFAYDDKNTGKPQPDHTIDLETDWRYALSYTSPIDQTVVVVFNVTGNTWWKANRNATRRYGVAFKVQGGSIVVKGQTPTEDGRTGSQKTYADIIGDKFNCLQFLLSYCKMFGLLFKVDHSTNTIKILLRDNYYGGM